jgi:hypothetical protein
VNDIGFVLAAYGVILGGMALYTVVLWRRLRAAQGFGFSVSRKPRPDRDRADEAR